MRSFNRATYCLGIRGFRVEGLGAEGLGFGV